MSYIIPEFKSSIVNEGFTPEDAGTRALYREVEAFAKQAQPIIIFGPSGSGKEFLARHYYNTLINTEFYLQNKENWPSRFNELRKQYSTFYSGQSLDVFLNSLRAGIFQAINSATIYPNLAESILFGHEANSFTGGLTSPGLLETIKHGVLFLDEIGELPGDLQAKLLRAVDPEINEGRRISGKIDYSLKDLIIISATNQPRDRIRDDFYYKLGIEVRIKGIDERPGDVLKAIPYFICKSIGKRKDYAAVINMLGIRGLRNISSLSDTDEVVDYADELAMMVSDEILKRNWPGNFRALRRALEASVLRIETPDDKGTFSKRFLKYFNYYMPQYSSSDIKASVITGSAGEAVIFPSPSPEIDFRILENISHKNIFQDMDNYEKSALSVFLSSTQKSGFRRKDLEEYYKKQGSIKHISQAHIRSRIHKLLDFRFLEKSGTGKSTRYHLAGVFMDQLGLRPSDIFSFPEVNKKWTDRGDEIEALSKVLLHSERIYLQAPARFGKSSFITLFSHSMAGLYNFYYYPLGETGIKKLFKDIIQLLQSRNIKLNSDRIFEDAVVNLYPFLDTLFISRAGAKPVLILDNVQYVSDADSKVALIDIAKKWNDVILILVGDAMDNALLDDFHEFPLGPWGKEA